MPTFAYTARDMKGALRSATIEARDTADVAAQLRKLRMTVVKIEATGSAKPTTKGSIPMRDIVIFTRQFSTMINSGLPLVQALDILSKQSEHKVLQEVTKQVVFDVESGHTVADALAKHPNAFTDLYVNMVAAGEAGGILDTILLRLAGFMEKNDALVRKVKGAMIYPAVIMSVAGIAVCVLLIFVIPVFKGMFAEAGQALPPAGSSRREALPPSDPRQVVRSPLEWGRCWRMAAPAPSPNRTQVLRSVQSTTDDIFSAPMMRTVWWVPAAMKWEAMSRA